MDVTSENDLDAVLITRTAPSTSSPDTETNQPAEDGMFAFISYTNHTRL